MWKQPLDRRQQVEIDFWRDSPIERPESDAVENIVMKATEAGVFLDVLRRYAALFARASDILELGGGQGWASCIVKKTYPGARVHTTDISPYAIASVPKWERVFDTKLDAMSACPSYQIPVEDSSLDLVFCFAAAHHFVAHRRTLSEMSRILRAGGAVLYMYEPSCGPLLYRFARSRVNRKRPEVPEDVLMFRRLQEIARSTGLTCSVEFFPSVRHRSPVPLLYYSVLRRVPPLQRLLPCTMNFLFSKQGGATAMP